MTTNLKYDIIKVCSKGDDNMKKLKIFIIIYVLIILLICGAITFIYFATDMLKSSKLLFNKYVSQIDLKAFTNFTDYEEFSKKTLTQSHTNEGSLSLKIGQDINEAFNFKTKNNLEKKAASGEITFSQDDEEKLGLSYLKDNEFYALKCIYSQYMALNRDELSEFGDKLGINLDGLQSTLNSLENFDVKQDLNDNEIVELQEKIKNIFQKYLNLVIEKFPNENYSKIKKEEIQIDGNSINLDGYKLTLTPKDIAEVLKEVLDTAKNDEELYKTVNSLLEKINKPSNSEETFENEQFEHLDFSEYQNFIEDLIKSFDGSINAENTSEITISVYKQRNKFIKLYVKIIEDKNEPEEYIDFSIENNNTIRINIVYDDNNNRSIIIRKNTSNEANKFDMSYTINSLFGIMAEAKISLALKKVSAEKFETGLNIDINAAEARNYNINISFNNITEFKDDIEIEKLNNDDYVSLNSLTKEHIELIAKDLEERIKQKIDFDKTIYGISMKSFNQILNRATESRKLQIEGQVRDEITLAVYSAKLAAETNLIKNANFSAATDLGINGKNSDIYKVIVEDLTSEKGFTVVPSEGKLAITYVTDSYKQACNNDAATIKVEITVSKNTFQLGEFTLGKSSY